MSDVTSFRSSLSSLGHFLIQIQILSTCLARFRCHSKPAHSTGCYQQLVVQPAPAKSCLLPADLLSPGAVLTSSGPNIDEGPNIRSCTLQESQD